MLEYLFPTMLTMAALSLNEFVDSMLVSNLLGSSAMAVVGFGSPVMLAYAALYTLLGNGGATLYALSLGRRDNATAGKAFSLAVASALAVGLVLVAVSFLFFDPLARVLCRDPALMPAFIPYLRTLLISAPLIITILTLVEFLPPSGAPRMATAINITANGVNLLMDYVYIRFFHMGVEGAAWATLTGYAAGALLVLAVVLRRRVTLHHSRPRAADLPILGKLCGLGSPSAVSQLGFALKFAFCNGQAVLYGGTAGIVAYSLCNQSISIISIFLAALAGSSMPLIAVLHGQRDFQGENSMLKAVMKLNALLSAVCFLAFVLFARPLAGLYNITQPDQLALAVRALRIFSVMYLFRGFCILFMKYLQVVDRKIYSMFISVFDGFGGIIPIAFVMGRLLGMDGLWLAFPLTAVLLMAIVLLWNRRIAARSGGSLRGWLLAPREDDAEAVFDATVFESSSDISSASRALMDFCTQKGLERRSATYTALALEEMAVYTRNRLDRHDYMDILARLYADRVEIDFRTLGNSFDPLASAPEDICENIRLLRSIADRLEYNYIMGMNCTRIVISRKKGMEA